MLRRPRIIRPILQERKRDELLCHHWNRKETQTELSLSKSTLSLSFPLLMNFFVLAMPVNAVKKLGVSEWKWPRNVLRQSRELMLSPILHPHWLIYCLSLYFITKLFVLHLSERTDCFSRQNGPPFKFLNLLMIIAAARRTKNSQFQKAVRILA